MPAIPVPRPYICAGCLRAQRRPNVFAPVRAIANGSVRRYAQATTQPRGEEVGRHEHEVSEKGQGATNGGEEKEEGAFTRRMREMSEEVLESGGHSALKAVDEAGFNADLKAELEQRIAGVNLRSTADLPDFASRHTRDLATTEAWTGTESLHDASLRMLNDAHKPLRLGRPPKMPGVPVPQSIDTGHKRVKDGGRGLRLANARDRSTVYSTLKEDEDLEDTEREKRFQELKDRFDPNARAVVPGTIQGLANLANKRIEDAIARGQFKNIKRGKTANVERDYNASSPFIDTTEYFMNKIIQKQEIVPPWIEKQQELTSAANKFRTRLRADWKRHAARMIASKGGSLIDQVKRAEAYAKAELDSNPLKKNQESFTTVDDRGHMSQISLSSELKVTPPAEESNAEPVVTEEIVAERVTLDGSPGAVAQTPAMATVEDSATQTIEVPVHTHEATVAPAPEPFRDPEWERIETSYWTVAIKDLNDKARSYNLQAPDLAKKPYFNLQRELNSCFADVAPQLAAAIIDRARTPPKKTQGWHNTGEKSVLDNIIGGPVRVRDERREKQYGFRQFWKDLWADKSSNPY